MKNAQNLKNSHIKLILSQLGVGLEKKNFVKIILQNITVFCIEKYLINCNFT